MSNLIQKIFNYESNQLSVIKQDSAIWFRGKSVADILKYTNPQKAIRDHVDSEDKMKLSQFSRGNDSFTLTNNEKNTIYINESGLYSLIMRSKLDSAKAFKRWVTSQVLPAIRKSGNYNYDMNHTYKHSLAFKIESETELHTKVVSFIKKRFPQSIFTASLGENQDTVNKRLDSYKKGYLKGSPDLIINNLHKHYTGFAIEFKTPNGTGKLSKDQSRMMKQYELNGFKTLISNDYDLIIEQLLEYFKYVRIKCKFCQRRFINSKTIDTHIKAFHKIE
jgi:prophage antirepressor-like protein